MKLETGINIGLPEIIVLTLMFLNIVVTSLRHGEHQAKYNRVNCVFWTVLIYCLLYWGGFFS